MTRRVVIGCIIKLAFEAMYTQGRVLDDLCAEKATSMAILSAILVIGPWRMERYELLAWLLPHLV